MHGAVIAIIFTFTEQQLDIDGLTALTAPRAHTILLGMSLLFVAPSTS